jgi:hypothetical protein
MQTKTETGMSRMAMLAAIPVIAATAIRWYRRSASRKAFKIRHGLVGK